MTRMLEQVDLQPFFDLARWLGQPSQQNRPSATLSHYIIYTPLPILAFMLQCVLVRQDKTRRTRIALGLLGAPWLVIAPFAVRWGPPNVLVLSINYTMTYLLLGLRMLEFAFRKEPVQRVKGKQVLPPGHRPNTLSASLRDMYDAMQLSLNTRGIGLDFGEGSGLKYPPGSPPIHNRSAWLQTALLKEIIPQFLFADLIDQLISRSTVIRAVQSGQVLTRELPWHQQVIILTAIPAIICPFLSLVYNIFGFAMVALRVNQPAEWPPLFGAPWASTSLHDFWAVRWHQLLRQTLLVTAGYPLESLFGKNGLIFGVFVSSGFFHSMMLVASDASHFDWPSFLFFTIQTFGLLVEQLFRKVTGSRVNGVLGWMWTVIFLYATGYAAAEVWIRQGFLNIHFIPPPISIFGRILQISAWR